MAACSSAHPADDEPLLVSFHAGLSERSIYLRYFEPLPLGVRTQHERLATVCTNTADSCALVAYIQATASRPERILAVGRLGATESPLEAAFAIVTADDARATELPHELLKWLMHVAEAYGFHSLGGELLLSDERMIGLCREIRFKLHHIPDDTLVRVHRFL